MKALITSVIVLLVIAGLAKVLPLSTRQPSFPNEGENVEPAAIATPSPSPPSKSENDTSEDVPCARLAQDAEFRPALNGTKILIPPEEADSLISEAKIQPMQPGNLLVMIGNTLYRLDGKKRIVWKYTEAQFMFDFTFIPATGLIYGTAGDGVMFILNAGTGKKLIRDAYMGKGAYGIVRAYGKDQCLVTSDFAMYREDWKRLNLRRIEDVMTDEVTDFRGTKALWTRSFPPDADLVVDGKRILAVTKTQSNIYVKEIAIPRKRLSR